MRTGCQNSNERDVDMTEETTVSDKSFTDRLQRIKQAHCVSDSPPIRYELPPHLREDSKRAKGRLKRPAINLRHGFVAGRAKR